LFCQCILCCWVFHSFGLVHSLGTVGYAPSIAVSVVHTFSNLLCCYFIYIFQQSVHFLFVCLSNCNFGFCF
jgi:hypothetical protein